MTQLTAQQVIDSQRQGWNRVASGWEKWDQFFEEQMAYVNHRLIGDARIKHGQRVLDLGSGTGYPALLAAEMVGTAGNVTGMDVAEQMLEVAGRKATRLGLTNVTFQPGDVTHLPFDADIFDAITSRFCLMFLPEIPKAAAEISRVLKPGGWVAAAVWSTADKNPSIRLAMETIKDFVPVPPPDPSAPGFFRLAKPSELADMFQHAGLVDVADQEFLGEWSYTSEAQYVRSLLELAAPIQNLMASLSPTQVEETTRRLNRAVAAYRRGDRLTFPIAVRIVAGRKPS
ncbi:MAG: class I SAM-dependent methyltransferase [Nitrospira sp.]|nr:class I SAM-dependent methyltransferase [Nitrospira sp.]